MIYEFDEVINFQHNYRHSGNYNIIISGATEICLNCISSAIAITNINFGNSITSIADYCCDGFSNLSAIHIPQNLKNIGNFAFYGCSKLSSIDFNHNLSHIGSFAFSKCSLVSVDFSTTKLTTISSCAFMSNSKITTIILPETINMMADSCFFGCDVLNRVILSGDFIEHNIPHITPTTFPINDHSIAFIFKDHSVIDRFKSDSVWNSLGNNLFAESDLSNFQIKHTEVYGVNDVIYTGNPMELDITVIHDNGSIQTQLIPNIDYSVQYYDNVNCGTATLVVTGGNKWIGQKLIHFNILPMNIENINTIKFKE